VVPGPHDPSCPKAVLTIRYRNDSIDWEETCIQFQDCKQLMSKVRAEIEARGGRCRREGDCLYATARRSIIEKVLAGLGDRLPVVVDVEEPVSGLE
jgi:hypothetical protein